jgi:hypothetical protein
MEAAEEGRGWGMTEEEWLSSNGPSAMLYFVQHQVSFRKLRLFTCACCRLDWHKFVDERSRIAVMSAETSADSPSPEGVLQTVKQVAKDAYEEAYYGGPAGTDYRPSNAAWALTCGADVTAFSFLDTGARAISLIYDIFGNPFRPVTFDPRWRTSDLVGLAQAIYEDKAFERMPIVGDALMDAGCEEEQIIAHCRGEGPHVRGCWVVDIILDKT